MAKSNSYGIWGLSETSKLKFRILCMIRRKTAANLFTELVEDAWKKEGRKELTDKEAEVINMRYGFGEQDAMKLREIAKKLDMRPEGVRRIELKALKKLRNKLMQQGIYGVLN